MHLKDRNRAMSGSRHRRTRLSEAAAKPQRKVKGQRPIEGDRVGISNPNSSDVARLRLTKRVFPSAEQDRVVSPRRLVRIVPRETLASLAEVWPHLKNWD